ncbi:MAG TPA: hypothetical protein VKH37_07265, partial [Ferruginibacter sp.]|nr:hypothetical protein [Ferruginibacter sp.]
MDITELKKFIKDGRFGDEKIKDLIATNRITMKDLEELLPPEKIKKIFYVSPEDHWEKLKEGKYDLATIRRFMAVGDLPREALIYFHERNIGIGNYDYNTRRELVRNGELDGHELVRKGLITQEELDDITDRMLPPVDIGFESWSEIPKLMPNRVDVFVLGIAGSGKSAFMAGLLYYARKNGRLSAEIDNMEGYRYAASITDAVKRGLLPPATPAEKMQYMACGFTSPKNETVPMTFIEMSGEVFEECFAKQINQMPVNFVNYLQHENNKVLILAIDYKENASTNKDMTQEIQFDFILKFMDKHGTLNNVSAICIL